MPFPPTVKREALLKSRRRCCVCHKFSGLYTDVHHLIQEANGGPNTLENAIALCHECHGDAGHYNPQHPIGNRYSPKELKQHRDTWWKWCSENPFEPLPNDPILISPEVISLPYLAPVSGTINVPVEIECKNRTVKNLYSIWIMINLPSANIDDLAIGIENSKRIGKLESRFIEPDTGNVLMKMESQGTGLPNYDFTKTSIFIKGQGKDAVGYLGISRLRPNEKRIINIKIKNVAVSKTKEIPLRVDLFSEVASTWLVEENNSFILNFVLPDKEMFTQGLAELSLINVEYLKRD